MEYPFGLKSSQENRLEEDIEIGIKVAFISIDGGRNEDGNARFKHIQNNIHQNKKLATQIKFN